ncbi:MAG: AsmA family protein [Chryseolinea sp.]
MVIILVGYGIIVSYKTEILAKVNEKIRESVNGEVQIGDLEITLLPDFPNISLSLKDIYLRGPRYQYHKREFLRAERINLNVRPFRLLRKQVSIKSIDVVNGEVFIFRTKDGYINLDVFKKSASYDTVDSVSVSSASIDFDEMNFRNVSIAFQDSLNGKSFVATFVRAGNHLISTDTSIHCHVKGEIDFVGLMFNEAKGSFLANKKTNADLNVEFFYPSKRLVIEASSLALEKSTINLSGALQFFLPGGNFEINIQSDKLDFQEGLQVVNKQLRASLSKFLISKPVVIDVHLKGDMGSGVTPSVDVSFALQNCNVTWKKLSLRNASLNGSFTNHKSNEVGFDDRNSEVTLDSVSGIIKSLPFTGSASFYDLTDPFLNLDVRFDSDLRKVNANVDTTRIKFIAGHFISKVKFQGKLNEYFDDAATRYHGKLQGETIVRGGKLAYRSKNIEFDSIEAAFMFTEKKFTVKDIKMRMNEDRISLSGSVTGFIPFFLIPEKKGKVLLNIYSPSLDFTRPLAQKVEIVDMDKNARDKKKVSDLLDQIYEKIEFDLSFKIDKFKRNDIYGTEIAGNVLLAGNTLQTSGMKISMAGGTVEFSSTVYNLADDVNPFALNASVRDADIKEFFKMFDNFKQNAIRSEHLEGSLNANIDVTAAIDNNFFVLMPPLKGHVVFNVKQGRISDFPPLENMSKFLFKKRDFTDVRFDEVMADFNVHGTELDISRMEVQSSVLTLFLEGRYSLKDSTNLSIQIPLSNLKKRDKDFVPQNVGTGAKVGLSVFLRASQGKDGKTVIAFDSFGKVKKGKTKSKE